MLPSLSRWRSAAAPLWRHHRRLSSVAPVMTTSDDEASLKKNELLVKMLAAPALGDMTEGVGVVVADKSGRFAKDDLVFSAKLGGVWKPVSKALSSRTIKLPPATPIELGAMFAHACTAYRIMASAVEGDVIINYGAETVVGQCIAQLAEYRDVKCVSLVSSHVSDPQDAVELLKNTGASVAVFSSYAKSWDFRELIADLGNAPCLLAIDTSHMDTKMINPILACGKTSFSNAKEVLTVAHQQDHHHAHILSNISAVMGKDSTITCYNNLPGAPLLPSSGSFDLEKWLDTADEASKKETFEQVLAMEHDLRIFGCRHDTSSLPKALEKSISAKVFLSNFRVPLWYSEEGLERSLNDEKTRAELYMEGWENIRRELLKDPKYATPIPGIDEIVAGRPDFLDDKRAGPQGHPYRFPPYV